MFKYINSLIERRQVKKIMQLDFCDNYGKRYKKIAHQLKNNMSNCNKSLITQKEETEEQLKNNSNYLSSTIVPIISIISILASLITSIVSNIFRNEIATLILSFFYIICLGLTSIALRYKDYEKKYLLLKLKCIEELEESEKQPKIMLTNK